MRGGPAVLILMAAGVVVAPSDATGATHRVPKEYPTIQAGIDAAVFGDTVLVAPGTYTDIVVRNDRTACAFLKDGVVLRSEAGSGSTTIDRQGKGSGVGAVIIGRDLLSKTTVVEGFAVTGAEAADPGIAVGVGGHITLIDCVLRDLDTGAQTGGLDLDEADAVIVDCEFVNCIGWMAGGIWQTQARIEVSGSSFRDCSDSAIHLTGYPGGVDETASVVNCEFIENSSPDGGGALRIGAYTGGVSIRGCHFEGNVASDDLGGAIIYGDDGFSNPSTIEDNVFVFNRVESFGLGGAVMVFGHSCTVRGNTFFGNHQAASQRGGAAIAFFADAVFENNIIAGSTGAAAVMLDSGVDVAGDCNVFWDNAEGHTDGYIFAPRDREVDPLFCGPSGEDLTLQHGSPCLPPNSKGCGLIGALGEGCGTVSVEPRSWGAIKSNYRNSR